MRLLIIFFWLMNGVLITTYGQNNVNTVEFEQLDSLHRLERRPIVIFIHTDWCKYCKAMQQTTFKDHTIIKLLNHKFYFIDLDAEQNRTINFVGRNFKYRPTGVTAGVHELVEQLATVDGSISYPTLCILNADHEIIFQYNQYINALDLQIILNKLLE